MVHQTTKTYILPLLIGGLVASIGFVSILVYTNPYQAGWLTHSFFYITLLLTCTGLSALTSLLIRAKFWPGIYSNLFATSLRQGLLVGLLFTGLLLLESFNIFSWWIALTLVLFLLTIEFFFLAPKK